MTPEEIEGREFFVGLRGYDKDEVHQFLAEVAQGQRRLIEELDAALTGQQPAAVAARRHDFEDLGASIAAILRTAEESASSMTLEAEAAALTLRDDAERYAEERRRAADDYAAAKRTQVDDLHAMASRAAEDAHEEAERRLADAEERIRVMEVESTDRARAAAESLVVDAGGRLAEVNRRADGMRARLREANDEIQLALMALGDPVDADDALRVAVGTSGGEHQNARPSDDGN